MFNPAPLGEAPLRFPAELWPDALDRELAAGLLPAFESVPIMLTDELANTVFLNERAEQFLGDRAEALVNRLSFSLLGYGNKGKVPDAMIRALQGTSPSWRGVVDIAETEKSHYVFVEASAIRRGERFVCGVIRISTSGGPAT